MACSIMFRNTNSIVSESDVTNGHENQTVETTLIRPVDTRWNSYYMMMDVVQNKKSAITITAQNPELALPPSKQVRYQGSYFHLFLGSCGTFVAPRDQDKGLTNQQSITTNQFRESQSRGTTVNKFTSSP